MLPIRPPHRRFALPVALVLGLAATACGWFDDPSPSEARLVVDGDGIPVRVIVSRSFVAAQTEVGNTQVEVLRADTFDVAPPFDRTFDIHDQQRFFAQVSRLVDSTRVRVRVMLDGDERYDESGTVSVTSPFRFLFLFNQIFGNDIEVL